MTQRNQAEVLKRLEHLHDMLHGLIGAVVDLARRQSGGLTPDELDAVNARLTKHAEAMEAIAKTPKP